MNNIENDDNHNLKENNFQPVFEKKEETNLEVLNKEHGMNTAKESIKDSELTIENFLKKNGEMKLLKEQRDATIGVFKFLFLIIFCYFLISPIFQLFVSAADRAWVLVLMIIPIAAICWCFYEYWSRGECWYICICRGIILDLEKTNKPVMWLCTFPMIFVYFFLILVAVLYAISYKPASEEAFWKRYVAAALYLIGILFIISLTKTIVDVEGSNRLLSVNMFVHLLGDVDVLKSRGYKVVHFSQIGKYIAEKKPETPFSWNDIFKLSHIPDPNGASKWNLNWGFKMAKLLRVNKELTS
jgi:hypothetical protein